MSDIIRLSEAVYVGLCHKIGTCEEVSMRRETADMRDVIWNKSWLCNDHIVMLSGSSREGFRLTGSDVDYMLWLRDNKVICNLSQAHHYRQPDTTLFLMECVDSRPGFLLLQLLTPSHYSEVTSSCVKVNDVVYISSTIYRTEMLRCHLDKRHKEHGPCINIVLTSSIFDLEIDYGHCLSCDFWPPLAAPWIQRCSLWPSPAVVYEIIVSGCHVMAIGSKTSPSEFFEWRLSFSHAEQKLVYAMNHCQFLVYGLLKLFLKEVINQMDKKKLLCSYFMKTAIFWEIQSNSGLSWCPQNTVICFWACFKRIMKWVYYGYCPNFFVAENNMFWNKICGSAQNNLFLQLHKLYQKGLSCLLYSTSIRSYLCETLYNPTNVIHLHENNEPSKVDNILNIALETLSFRGVLATSDMSLSLTCRYLKTIDYLSKTSLTKYQGLQLYLHATECRIATAFCIHETHICGNRTIYRADRLRYKLLKTVAISGCVSHMLYMAIFCYKTCRCTEALAVLHIIEIRFNQHILTCNGRFEKYIVDLGGHCLLSGWKKVMFRYFVLYNDLCYINQLVLEQRVSKRNGEPFLSVPPLVLLRMLYVLCYNNEDRERSQQALKDLYFLVHYDTGMYIQHLYRDISYQILGICQEICGDFSSAYQSYNLSLRCEPDNKITEASLLRINHVLAHLENIH